MRLKFDSGDDFITDLKEVVNDAIENQPALIVVPTEREVKTFERNFKDDLDDKFVWCCSFSDFYNATWMSTSPRPKFIYIFRIDDALNKLSADASIKYATVKGFKRREEKKEEETS